jgi:hypothetical protein
MMLGNLEYSSNNSDESLMSNSDEEEKEEGYSNLGEDPNENYGSNTLYVKDHHSNEQHKSTIKKQKQFDK